MTKMIKVEFKDAISFIDESLTTYQSKINDIHDGIINKKLRGSDYLGWLDLPHVNLDQKMVESVARLRENTDILVVVGIGGSYLGAKAGLDFLSTPFEKATKQIIFAGHHLSDEYLENLIAYLKDKRFAVNVISKSGTTTEPAIAFRFIKKLVEEKYGAKSSEYIVATTDKARGALYKLATQKGYDKFVIEDDIGGRYSVLSPVGLLPFLYKGFDVKSMLEGAKLAYEDLKDPSLMNNQAYRYALTRYLLYKTGKKVEILTNYEPRLTFFSEWWKQLFGESEGKEHKGLFVASTSFTTDLHSMGQYIQEGERILFETVLNVASSQSHLKIEKETEDLDGLNYLAGKSVYEVNQKAFQGTLLAHVEGNVPNIVITLPNLSETTFGYLTYFFMRACAMSAYLLNINPFDQPGVESYKTKMFALLGKEGYEDIIK